MKTSNIIKGYKIINRVKWFIAKTLNRFNPFVITRLLKAHSKDINALKSANDALRDSIMTLSQAYNEDVNILIDKCNVATSEIEGLKEINKLASKRHKRLLEKVNDLDKALQLATAMTKTEHDNLKNSFNEYVLRPKAEKMIKDYDKEDYSYEYELEQKNEALIEALRQQGISDNVINNIIDTLLLKLKLDDKGGK